MVKHKLFYCFLTLENRGNRKRSFDADDMQAAETWKVNLPARVIGNGCGGGYDNKVGLFKQLLIRPYANGAGGNDAGRNNKKDNDQAWFQLFRIE